MHILITGSTGFLNVIIRTVLQHNYSIIGLLRFNSDCNIQVQSSSPRFIGNIVIYAAFKVHLLLKSDTENTAFFDVIIKGS